MTILFESKLYQWYTAQLADAWGSGSYHKYTDAIANIEGKPAGAYQLPRRRATDPRGGPGYNFPA